MGTYDTLDPGLRTGARPGVRRNVLEAVAVHVTVLSECKRLTELSGRRNGSGSATQTGL